MLIHTRRILCVANYQALPSFHRSRLADEGYELLFVNTAIEGDRLARVQKFDLYLFSERLRTGSGIELCRHIRVYDGRTPAIIFLCKTGQRQGEKVRTAKAQSILPVPTGADLLLETVRRLIKQAEVEIPSNPIEMRDPDLGNKMVIHQPS